MPTRENLVFLSYSRRDGVAAGELRALLTSAGELVYQDVAAMRLGESWMTQLQEAITRCSAFVVLIGREGVRRWVVAEVEAALKRHYAPSGPNVHELPIYPVMLPEARSETVPIFLRAFQTVQWAPGEPIPSALRDALREHVTLPVLGSDTRICPFPGLNAFDAENAKYFFGRQLETLQALESLGASRVDPEGAESGTVLARADTYCKWLQVEGNSGSGKSSLVMAGLVPMIADGALWPRTGLPNWKIIGPLVPGRDPVARLAEELERALKPDPGTRDLGARLERLSASNDRGLAFAIHEAKERQTGYLLVVDQFEELFTLSAPASRRTFDAVVANAIADTDCPLFLVNTIRADFLDRYEDLPRLASIANEQCHRFMLGPISPEGLREAIELPAHLAGIDAREVGRAILREARDEPGALPLVANALWQIWDPDRPSRLDVAEFDARGGLAGLLSAGADDVLKRIEREIPGGRIAALELLMCLTRISPDGRHTRQRVSRAEAIQAAGNGNDELGEKVLNMLAGSRDARRPQGTRGQGLRLVTTGIEGGQPFVDLVHETLVRARRMTTGPDARQAPYWPTLYDFVMTNRRRNLRRQELAIQVERWQAHGLLTRWLQLAGPFELLRYRHLRLAKSSLEQRFLIQSRRAVASAMAVAALFVAVLVESAWWVAVNHLPLIYVFVQPLWWLGWTPTPDLVNIRAGQAAIGCSDVHDGPSGQRCAVPGRQASVAAFSIGRNTVTFLQYDRFVWATGRKGSSPTLYPLDNGFGRLDHPVINVSWEDASRYVEWLRRIKADPSYRLPTDAEWEYAARAGSEGRFPWGDEDPGSKRLANCGTCASEYANKGTAPVGRFPPNAFGLNDMVGNVWQWTADVPAADQRDIRIIRGGSWNNPSDNLQVWRKNTATPRRQNSFIGFRVARGTAAPPNTLSDLPIDRPARWSSDSLSAQQTSVVRDLSFEIKACSAGRGRCDTWAFKGLTGMLLARDGAQAALAVRAFDEHSLTVEAQTLAGPNVGRPALVRIYRRGGAVRIRSLPSGDGSRVAGSTAEVNGDLAQVELPIPVVMRACVTPDIDYCWSYRWDGSSYVAVGEGGRTAGRTARAKLLEFSATRLATWGEMSGGYWSYSSGRVSGAGNRMMDGQYVDSNGTRGTLMYVWGEALEELPTTSLSVKGVDNGASPVCYRWITGVVC